MEPRGRAPPDATYAPPPARDPPEIKSFQLVSPPVTMAAISAVSVAVPVAKAQARRSVAAAAVPEQVRNTARPHKTEDRRPLARPIPSRAWRARTIYPPSIPSPTARPGARRGILALDRSSRRILTLIASGTRQQRRGRLQRVASPSRSVQSRILLVGTRLGVPFAFDGRDRVCSANHAIMRWAIGRTPGFLPRRIEMPIVVPPAARMGPRGPAASPAAGFFHSHALVLPDAR